MTTKPTSTGSHLDADGIEQRKDNLNLKPALDFVERHLPLYEEALTRFMARPTTSAGLTTLETCEFLSPEVIGSSEQYVTPAQFGEIFPRLPDSVLALSNLSTVSYDMADKIPIPDFDGDGNLIGASELVSASKFPREGDHPHRILIGNTSPAGTQINVTAIPASISRNARACWFYQLHVMLHEIFHTVELPRRDPDERDAIQLRYFASIISMDTWWRHWETVHMAGIEPRFVTRYGATYAPSLTEVCKTEDYSRFSQAIAEQVCESFVAEMLGIAPNDDGWTDFRTESFGNVGQRIAYEQGFVPARNLKACLMYDFCRRNVERRQ